MRFEEPILTGLHKVIQRKETQVIEVEIEPTNAGSAAVSDEVNEPGGNLDQS